MKRLKNTLWHSLCVSGAILTVGCASGESLDSGYESPGQTSNTASGPGLVSDFSGGNGGGLVSDPFNDTFSHVVENEGKPIDIEVFQDSINYMDELGAPRLRTKNLVTGEEERSIDLAGYPLDAAVDDSNLYYTLPQFKKIRFVAHGAKTVETLFATVNHPMTLAVDDTSVYWGDDAGCVYKGLKSESSATLISCEDGVPTSMTVSAGEVFWATNEGAIYKSSQPGITYKVAVSDNIASDIVVDTQSVYWADDVRRELRSVRRYGGAITTVANNVYSTSSLTADAKNVYATSQYAGTVWQYSKENFESKRLISQQQEPFGLTQDKSNIYWINKDVGDILRLKK